MLNKIDGNKPVAAVRNHSPMRVKVLDSSNVIGSVLGVPKKMCKLFANPDPARNWRQFISHSLYVFKYDICEIEHEEGERLLYTGEQLNRIKDLETDLVATVKKIKGYEDADSIDYTNNFSVLVGGKTILDVKKNKGLERVVDGLKKTYSDALLNNIRISLLGNSERISRKIGRLPVPMTPQQHLWAQLETALKDDSCVALKAFLAGQMRGRGITQDRPESEVKALIEILRPTKTGRAGGPPGLGLLDKFGCSSDVPELKMFHEIFERQNEREKPVIVGSSSEKENVLKVLDKKSSSLLRTASRRMKRTICRIGYNVGLLDEHPTEMRPKHNDIRQNARDLVAIDGGGDLIYNQSRRKEDGSVNPMYAIQQKYARHRESLDEIVLVILNYYEKLDAVFTSNPSEARTVLDDCLKDLESAWRKSKGRVKMTQEQKGQLVKLLAYAVPDAQNKEDFLEFMDDHKVEQKEADFVEALELQNYLLRRREKSVLETAGRALEPLVRAITLGACCSRSSLAG